MKNKLIIKGKKAQLFGLIVIVILFLVFVSFEIFSYLNEKNVVKKRISTMDDFLYSVEKNMERQLYISGFRTLFLAENEISITGNYIDVDDFFSEAFFNGTINGNPEDILVGATYDDILDSVNDKASKINVNITFSNPTINVSHDNPWFVKFSLISDFVMEDKANLARWDKRQIISAYIPVTEFEDPLFIINTYAKVSRKVKKTPYEGNYVSGSNVTNLISHVNNNYYAVNPYAPSFLNRLEGNLSSDENGIESFVNIPELSSQGLVVEEKSDIDYIYFSSGNPTYYSVTGMHSWFRIDEEDNHLTKYNVSGLIY